MFIQVARYSLVTPMIEQGIEHKMVVTSVVFSGNPSDSSLQDYQVHAYFGHVKKPINLLNLDPFPKENLEIKVEYIAVTPRVCLDVKSKLFWGVFEVWILDCFGGMYIGVFKHGFYDVVLDV